MTYVWFPDENRMVPQGKDYSETHFKTMTPNRRDTYSGVYIPAWLFTLGLSAKALVTWGVMARCAGRNRRLRGYSHDRIAATSGLSLPATRRALDELESVGVIASLVHPGKPSDYAFRGMASETVTWRSVMREADAESAVWADFDE